MKRAGSLHTNPPPEDRRQPLVLSPIGLSHQAPANDTGTELSRVSSAVFAQLRTKTFRTNPYATAARWISLSISGAAALR